MVILFLFIILSVLSCTTNNTIKIGVLFPMTGDAGSYGEKGEKAIRLAIKKINNSGGVNGAKIIAIIEDSKAEPKTGITAAQKLIFTDKVVAIAGDIVSSVTLAVSPLCEKNKIILIAPTSSAPDITTAGEYIYRVWPSDLAEGAAIGTFAKNKRYKRAVILHLNNDYGISIAKIFKLNFESDSSKVVLSTAYQKNQTDFRTALLKAKAEKPDVIYTAGYYSDVARILVQAKELNLNTQFLGVTAIEDDEFLRIAGNTANGMIYPLASGFDINSNNPKTKEFVNSFNQEFGYIPGWVESHCYDAFMLIVEGIKNSDNKDYNGTSIKKYLDNMERYQGVTGEIIFDENGDVLKSIYFKEISDGKFRALK